MINIKTISERFFADPEWKQVEELILEYVEPLKDMGTIDTTQPAEAVKAEVISRITSYNSLLKFLGDTKMVSSPPKPITRPFK